MNLSRYLYKGPQSAVSLRVGEKRELLEVQLSPGKPVKLPADHEYTQVLLELQHLEPLAPEAKAAAKVPSTPQTVEKE